MEEVNNAPICSVCDNQLSLVNSNRYICHNCGYIIKMLRPSICEHCLSKVYIQPIMESRQSNYSINNFVKFMYVCSNPNCPGKKVKWLDKYSCIVESDSAKLTYTNLGNVIMISMMSFGVHKIIKDSYRIYNMMMDIINDVRK